MISTPGLVVALIQLINIIHVTKFDKVKKNSTCLSIGHPGIFLECKADVYH